MTGTRRVLELARADVLERTRRSGFLLTLAGAAGLAYTVHADVWTVLVGGRVPARGPASTGTLVAVVTSLFLSLAAFYVVRGTVARDVRTGVGPILATTPTGPLPYVAGKFLSNVAVLGAMLSLLAGLAVAVEGVRAGGVSAAGAWRVVSPGLLITGPALVAVASVAVLFDTVRWLRGAAGNAAYFFLWVGALSFAGFDSGSAWTDVTGLSLVFETLLDALRSAVPGASAEGLTITANPELGRDAAVFAWSGIGWSPDHVGRRLWWVAVGGLVTAVSAACLRLFDPFGDRAGPLAPTAEPPGDPSPSAGRDDAGGALPGRTTERGAGERRARAPGRAGDPAGERPPLSDLPPPDGAGAVLFFLRTVRAELRLLLAGRAWWWYAGLVGINATALFLPPESVATALLAAWLFPLAAWSTLGCRERLEGTAPLLFSAAAAGRRQLPAQLAAGVALAALAAAVPLLRLAVGGDGASLAAAGAGALFVPALALCLGVWTGVEKSFQAIYLVLWYLGPANEIAALDFMGTTGRALEAGATAGFAAAAAALAALAWWGRRWRLRTAG